jgi:inhibitor of KinA
MHHYHPYTIFPLGDSALTVDFGNLIDEETNRKALRLFHQLKNERHPWITDLIPGYSSLTIYYNLYELYHHKQADKSAFETMAEMIETLASKKPADDQISRRTMEVPVCYDESFATDLQELADANGLEPSEVIELHTARTYRIYMIGFLPGFAYMGEVDERIVMPRRTVPRTVAPGSVGIAGKQTGIYPLQSPGGWNIIGKTPLKLFDRELPDPVLFQPGDEIKFFSISKNEFAHYQSRSV